MIIQVPMPSAALAALSGIGTRSARSRSRPVADALLVRLHGFHRDIQCRLARPRHTANFMALSDRALSDIGLHRCQVISAVHQGPKGIPENDDSI